MSTDLYLRRTTRNARGLANTKLSAAISAVDFEPAGGVTVWDMMRGKGAAVSTVAYSGPTNTNPYHGRLAIFVSPYLKPVDIASQTITLKLNLNETNAAANAFLCPAIGVVKQDGSVRGYCVDADSNQGTEIGTNNEGRVLTFPGAAAVTGCIDTDRIFVEILTRATQGNATQRTITMRFAGLQDVVDTVAQTDSAALLSFTQDIDFHGARAIAA